MVQAEQAGFDSNPAKNHLLFFARGRARIALFALLSILALMIWVSSLILDPKWSPGHVHAKGTWIVLLLALMPIAVRAALLAVATGWIAELGYRTVIRAFDTKPDSR